MAKTLQTNPWLSIWTQPKKTIRAIVNTDAKMGFLILCAIYGLPLAFNLAQSFAFSTSVPVWAILVGSLVVCTFLGVIGISISAWLLHFTGRYLKGKADYTAVRAAVAWSNVPNIVTIGMWVLLLIVFGGNVFNKDFSQGQYFGYQAGILFIVMLVESVVSIWGFIILLNALAEVQGFSIFRALLNIIIPFIVVVAVIYFAGWFIWGTGAIHN